MVKLNDDVVVVDAVNVQCVWCFIKFILGHSGILLINTKKSNDLKRIFFLASRSGVWLVGVYFFFGYGTFLYPAIIETLFFYSGYIEFIYGSLES